MKFVDPKTDIAFKKIFGNEAHKNVLIEFLNEMLDLDYLIADVTITNSYQPPTIFGLKETALDIKATDTKGRQFIIEMQVEKELAFAKRALYYSSKAYSQQLKTAEKYHELKPVIFLGILDFTLFEHEKPLSRHLILNTQTMGHDLKDLEFNFIELPKFTLTETALETVTDKWMYFLSQAPKLDHIPSSTNTPALQQAYHIAEQHTWTAEELEIYEAQGLKLGKAKNALETAFVDGERQGIEKGEKAKAIEVAKTMLTKGFDVNTIAEITKLTSDEIQALR
jgi:predicted transposase/invertase (TIGR01784 family)